MTSGIQGATSAAGCSSSYNITVANYTVSFWGYSFSGPAAGGISPINSFRGLGINTVNSRSGVDDWELNIATIAAVPQNFISYALVQDTLGAMRLFLPAAAATFASGAGSTRWTWGTGSSAVWTASATRQLIIG